MGIIERGRLQWYGAREEDGRKRYSKQCLEWWPEGRKPVGCPKIEGLLKVLRGEERIFGRKWIGYMKIACPGKILLVTDPIIW